MWEKTSVGNSKTGLFSRWIVNMYWYTGMLHICSKVWYGIKGLTGGSLAEHRGMLWKKHFSMFVVEDLKVEIASNSKDNSKIMWEHEIKEIFHRWGDGLDINLGCLCCGKTHIFFWNWCYMTRESREKGLRYFLLLKRLKKKNCINQEAQRHSRPLNSSWWVRYCELGGA